MKATAKQDNKVGKQSRETKSDDKTGRRKRKTIIRWKNKDGRTEENQKSDKRKDNGMIKLPIAFTDRMKQMLDREYEAFLQSYEEPRLRGLRVNTLKISPEEFEKIAPFPVTRVPWTDNGYFYANDIFPARHPYYAAGLYYLQEPSAMTPASRFPVEPGERVLDLCAAPGGKATELAAKLRGRGLLVANDASNSRAKALLRNLELFGVKNMLVTNEMPARLAEAFPEFFDKILVDAPCSGEGMFRKAPEIVETWSPERVDYFSKQQRNILENAYTMLRPGGSLMYSTCTFSPDEDEQMIAWFLREYPDMEILPIAWYDGFSEGRPDYADGNPELRKCVRIWPHKMNGEGHFLAYLHKQLADTSKDRSGDSRNRNTPETGDSYSEGSDRIILPEKHADDFGEAGNYPSLAEIREADRKSGKKRRKQSEPRNRKSGRKPTEGTIGNLTREQTEYFRDFAENPGLPGISNPDTAAVEAHADKAYLSPSLPEGVRGMNFLRNGMYLGEWKKKRFEPSQQLAMSFETEGCANRYSMAAGDPRVEHYLRGETITLEPGENCRNGWYLICVDSFPLGWGKIAGTVIKNKYPVSWRVSD